MNDIYFILGKNIKKFRIKANLTINELSKKVKISKTTLTKIELGQANPLISTLLKISKALKVEVSDLCIGF